MFWYIFGSFLMTGVTVLLNAFHFTTLMLITLLYDHHDITEILLKVALNIINLTMYVIADI